MASEITNYKCPACTGPLHFCGTSGKMQCDYCDSIFGVDEIEEMYAAANEKAEAATEANKEKAANADEWEISNEQMAGEGMKSYSCPSCGAELICEDTLAASSCPYCGNPTVVPGQFSGMLKPDYVVPFKLEKDSAVKALKNHYKGKFLLPKEFSDQNHIEEVKGLYVPFWLFNGKAAGTCEFEGVKETKTRLGNNETIIKKYYSVSRGGEASFEKIPADGSSKMPDDVMDSIEPYDYSEIKDFSKAYLTGYLADIYDVSAEECAPRAVARAKKSLRDTLYNDITGYNTVSDRGNGIKVEQGTISYAMMPVWLLNTKYKDKNYLFAMNGQTGKLVGDLPMNVSKLITTLLITAFVLIVLGMAILDLSFFGALIGAAIVDVIVYIALTGQLKSVAKATQANQYIVKGSERITYRNDVFIRETKEVRKIEK